MLPPADRLFSSERGARNSMHFIHSMHPTFSCIPFVTYVSQFHESCARLYVPCVSLFHAFRAYTFHHSHTFHHFTIPPFNNATASPSHHSTSSSTSLFEYSNLSNILLKARQPAPPPPAARGVGGGSFVSCCVCLCLFSAFRISGVPSIRSGGGKALGKPSEGSDKGAARHR